jgi:hypothetical protein
VTNTVNADDDLSTIEIILSLVIRGSTTHRDNQQSTIFFLPTIKNKATPNIMRSCLIFTLFFHFTGAFTLNIKTSLIAPHQNDISPPFRRYERLSTHREAYPPRKNRKGSSSDENNNEIDDEDDYDSILEEPRGKRGDGRNWIEKSSPYGIGSLGGGKSGSTSSGADEKQTDGYYDLGVNGESFQTGSLSARMYDALMSVAKTRFPEGSEMPSELQDVYKLYAMDITAKEAVKAALDQNGLELAIDESDNGQDEGLWGDIDSVHLLDPNTGEIEEGTEEYDSFDSAVEEGDWEPGQPFNFIVRNVPARLKELDIEDFLSKLDPDGKLRKEARDKGITMPDEDVASLKDLGIECDRRTKVAPYETQDESTVYKGDGSKGYRAIKRSDLLFDSMNADGTENDASKCFLYSHILLCSNILLFDIINDISL